MKKFNIDELIWFIIQILLLSLIYYLIATGNITYFSSGDMIIYFYLSFGILVLFSVAQFSKIFTVKSRVEITNKFIPITVVLILSFILLFILPAYRVLKLNSIDDKLTTNMKNLVVINNENYNILKEIKAYPNDYIGDFIEIVAKVDNFDVVTHELFLVREEVSCCQSDKNKIFIKAKGINKNYENGTWLKIIGEIHYDSDWYIDIKEYKITSEPKEVYFHQEL